MGSALRVSNPNTWASTVEELHSRHRGAIAGLITAFEEAVLAGGILTRVKGALRHGEWLPWIDDFAPFSQRTAWEYMSAFERQDEIRPKLEAASNLNWRSLINAGANGNAPNKPQQLHESNFYSHSIGLTQKLMGKINSELKDHPIESWGRNNWISIAAATEPIAELHGRLKTLIDG